MCTTESGSERVVAGEVSVGRVGLDAPRLLPAPSILAGSGGGGAARLRTHSPVLRSAGTLQAQVPVH